MARAARRPTATERLDLNWMGPSPPQALSKDMAEHDRPSPDEPLDFPEDLVDALANKKLLKHKDKTVRCVPCRPS